MNSVKRARLSAWLLLVVYMPLLALTTLHVHSGRRAEPQEMCADCAHHVSHAGHIRADVQCCEDCVLCQLQGIPYVAAAPLLLPLLPRRASVLRLPAAPRCRRSDSGLTAVRAPPAV